MIWDTQNKLGQQFGLQHGQILQAWLCQVKGIKDKDSTNGPCCFSVVEILLVWPLELPLPQEYDFLLHGYFYNGFLQSYFPTLFWVLSKHKQEGGYIVDA